MKEIKGGLEVHINSEKVTPIPSEFQYRPKIKPGSEEMVSQDYPDKNKRVLTVITENKHNLRTGQIVNIQHTNKKWSGDFIITVLNSKEFTYLEQDVAKCLK